MLDMIIEQRNNIKLLKKEPTICAKCRNCINKLKLPDSPKPHLTEVDLIKDIWKCKIKQICFMDGEEYFPYCRDKNHGNCPDYEPKEVT